MSSLISTAINILTARSCTEKELRLRLEKKFADKSENIEEIDAVCLRLRELNLLNDTRYAENRAAGQKHKGNRFIGQNLKQKGVASGIIEEVLAELPDEFPRALEEARKKQWSLKGREPQKARDKLTRFLISRCFSYGVISKVIEQLVEEEFFEMGD